MNREQWIQQLRKIGLSGYESQVYLALLGETNAPASRIVRKSGVPQSKVYGALESLIQHGFAEQVLGEVKMYRGVPPRQAFATYRQRVEDNLAKSKSDMSQLEMAAPGTPSNDPLSLGIRLLRQPQFAGVRNVVVAGVKNQFLTSLKAAPALAPDTAGDMRLIRQGADVRYIVLTEALKDPVQGPALYRHAEETGVVRFLDVVPTGFSVVDGSMVLIEVDEIDGSKLGLVIPNNALAESMKILFNSLWSQARTLEQLPIVFREPVAS
jgi:sugar-specific transcriptional regulator TrmB